MLEREACASKRTTVAAPKKSLKKARAGIFQETLRATVDEEPENL